MKEQITAKAYASALSLLGDESKIDIAREITDLNIVINENNNLENLLFLDVFTIDEKTTVFIEICEKLKLSTLLKNFTLFLIQEKRMNIFPLIFKELIVLDDHKKGFLRGVICGSDDAINKEDEDKILEYLKKKIGKEPKLTYEKNERVTAGYRVTVGDLQLDASIDNQLEQFKSSILGE